MTEREQGIHYQGSSLHSKDVKGNEELWDGFDKRNAVISFV